MTAPAVPQGNRTRFRRWILLDALLLGLVGLLSLTYPVEELSRRSGDLYFRLRAPEQPSNQVALVLIDDGSLKQYGRWPWPRSILARLVRAASAQHPRALGVDILLSEPEDEEDDHDLAMAFQEAGGVVLAAKIGSGLEGQAWVEPLALFARSAAGIGHVQAELGPDGICRRVPASEMTAAGPRPAFALEVARVALGKPLEAPRAERGEPQVERLSPEFLIVDYRGQILPDQSSVPFPFVSAGNLLEGKAGSQLQGRAVLIGFASTEITDRLPTPVSDQLPMPGVEIHANLVDALLAGRNLRPLDTNIQALLLVGVSLVLTWVLLRRSGWSGLLASVALTLGCYAAGYGLFLHYQRLIAFGPFLCLGVLAPLLAQLENLLDVDRGLTRSLRQLNSALRAVSTAESTDLRAALRPEVMGGDLHWKVATVNQLEAELSSLYAFDHSLLESIQEGLAVFAPGGQLIFRNAYWEEFCRRVECEPAAELEEFLGAVGQPQWRERAGKPSERLETELLRDTGLWQVRAVTLPSVPHAGTGALMVVVTDLTAQLERDRARAEALGFVTHELRTPLVSIQGFAEFLLRYPQAPGSSEAAQTIFEESKRLVAMINTYLDVLRMESGARPLRRDPVDVEATMAQVEKVMRPLSQAAGIRITMPAHAALPSLTGDSALIGGALLNLVSNAVKYSPAGSDVSMQAVSGPGYLALEVLNQGTVIPAEDLARLFEPFYRRTDHEGPVRGWGLGLAFVNRIAEAHGGRVEATSDAVAGTKFRIVLPTAPAAVSEVAV